jgi:hypothetical protein
MWNLPSTGPTIGPFHVLCGSDSGYSDFATAGVTAYWSTPHASPPHGASHVHTPPAHTCNCQFHGMAHEECASTCIMCMCEGQVDSQRPKDWGRDVQDDSQGSYAHSARDALLATDRCHAHTMTQASCSLLAKDRCHAHTMTQASCCLPRIDAMLTQ